MEAIKIESKVKNNNELEKYFGINFLIVNEGIIKKFAYLISPPIIKDK